MTDKEKSIMEEWTVTQEEAEAEMYTNEKHCSKCISCGYCIESAIEDRCKAYKESYTDYLNGLAEGRKEFFEEGYKKATERAYERQQDLTNTYIKDGEKIKQLEKENEELKEQIEKMKKEIINLRKVINTLYTTDLSDIEEVGRIIDIGRYGNYGDL